MQTFQERDVHTLTRWSDAPAVQRWRAGLLQVTGLSSDEAANRLETLFHFCLQHALDPEGMAEECRKSADRIARRAFYLRLARATPANLIVQSFLVHNGVNVFDDLICMPRTREQIVAEQGKEWVATSDPS
jgi:hypothetical protein